MTGNLIGLAVLALPIVICALFIPESKVPAIMWPFVYLVLALMGWFMWTNEKYAQGPLGWLAAIAVGLVLGLLFFAADVLIGQQNHPELSLIEGAKTVGGPFGFAFTVIVVPAFLFVAVGGLARGLYIERRK